MNLLKRSFDFYLNSSIHVAIAVVCLTWITYLEFNLQPNNRVLVFTFFATVTGYNFVKYFGVAKFNFRSLSVWLKQIQIFSLFSFMAMLFFAAQIQYQALSIIVVLGAITFLYAIPFFPKPIIPKKAKNLRAISGLKIYIIAVVWAITVVVFPLVNENHKLDTMVYLILLQRFLFVIIIMLPFEIRDMKNDSLKLLTIPQQIGVFNTKLIGVLMLVVCVLLEYLKNRLLTTTGFVFVLIHIITLGFLVVSSVNQKKYYSAFWVEALPIFWLVLYLLFS